ncbi:MAG: cell division protein FtsW [Ruminococcaceae bacterium]|nr:cell division protein FtsW [Oscillospiraceae bacterium]
MRRRDSGLLTDLLLQADWVLFGLCSLATFYGMVLILSATHTVYHGTLKYVAVQGVGYLLGSIFYFLLSSLDVAELSKKWKWVFGFNVGFILLLLTPFGMTRNGNRAWLGVNDLGRRYGVGFLKNFPFYIQPAEIVKITFIILLAQQLMWLREEHDLKRFRNVIQPTAHVLFMFALYYVISRDAGSGLVYLFVFVCMAFAAGMAARWLILGLGGVAGAVAAAWKLDILRGDWYKRIKVVFDHSFDPLGAGWQQTRGMLALGSGGLTGQGLFHGTQTQSPYRSSLPERQTDYIFCVCGEELGFVGCALVIIILLAIVIRCFLVAREANTQMESLVCVGMAGMLIFQTVANLGMCLFLLPVIGLTLPFFSYGGTSVMTLFAAMGVVSGIKKRSRPEWLMNS